MDYARSNLLTRGMRGDDNTVNGVSFAWDGDWYHVSGTATGNIGWRAYKSTDIPIVADKKYTLSVEFAGGIPDGVGTGGIFQLFSSFSTNTNTSILQFRRDESSKSFSVDASTLASYGEGFQIWGPTINKGKTVDLRCRWMLVEGDTPAAWAPAKGETLAGEGALMSANLWSAENVTPAGIPEDGIYACSGLRGVRTNVTLDRLEENQTFHCGFSVNPGKDDNLNMALAYRDAAGSVNNAYTADVSVPAGKWTRVSGSAVIPSGMTVFQMVICNNGNASGTSGWKVTNPTLSLGSPVCLASSAHTPYATQDHVMVKYDTVTGLANAAQSTANGAIGTSQTLYYSTASTTAPAKPTAQVTSTSTTARNAWTTAMPVYSGSYPLLYTCRQLRTQAGTWSWTNVTSGSYADFVKEASDTAKTLAGYVRKVNTNANGADGMLVGYSGVPAGALVNAAGSFDVRKVTWSSGGTPTVGAIIARFGEKVIELGKNSQDAIINMLGGLVTIKATRTGISDGAWCEIFTDKFMSISGYRASRIAAGYKDEAGFLQQGVAEVMVDGGEGDGGVTLFAGGRDSVDNPSRDNSFAMSPTAYTLSHPEYLLAALMDVSKVSEDLDTCGPGIFSYISSTANRPTDWGVCLSFVSGSGDWLFQVALPTAGDPRWRRNINGAGWTSWWTITSQ